MFTTFNGNPCDAEPASWVEHGVIPVWLGERIRKVCGPGQDGSRYLCPNLLKYHYRHTYVSQFWLDHFGSTLIDGVAIFVSEPYYSIDDEFPGVEQLARDVNCTLVVSDESCWYPGTTIRMALMPKELDYPHGDRRVTRGSGGMFLLDEKHSRPKPSQILEPAGTLSSEVNEKEVIE